MLGFRLSVLFTNGPQPYNGLPIFSVCLALIPFLTEHSGFARGFCKGWVRECPWLMLPPTSHDSQGGLPLENTALLYMWSFLNDKPFVLEPHLNVPDIYGLTHGFPLKFSLAAPPRISTTTVPSPFLSFIQSDTHQISYAIQISYLFSVPCLHSINRMVRFFC